MIRNQRRSLANVLNIFLICIICLCITFANALSAHALIAKSIISETSETSDPASSQIIDRFNVIKTKMAKLRFCNNESCFYRNVTSKIVPPPIKILITAPLSPPPLSVHPQAPIWLTITLSMSMIIGNWPRAKSSPMLLIMYLSAIAMKSTAFTIATPYAAT